MAVEEAAGREIPLEQNSKILSAIWINFYTALLSIVTLGIFGFWGRTQLRRKVWGETIVDGEPLEYIGKGSELFFGFLIASVLIALPGALIVIGAQFLDPMLAVLIILVLYVVLILLALAVPFLVRRYQLSRTTWRGVRFVQDGNPFRFALISLGYGILTSLTLGWYAPAMRLRLARYQWSRTYFGSLQFEYDDSSEARTEPVWKSFALSWFGVFIYYIAISTLAFMIFVPGGQPIDVISDPQGYFVAMAQFYAVAIAGALVLIFFVAWHEAVMLRQITKSIKIGGISLGSRLNTWDIIELAITNTLLVVFTLGFGYMAAQMRLWRRIVRKLEARGDVDLTKIWQSADRGPTTGEGLAMAFDMGMNI